jgi:hypothetical protein
MRVNYNLGELALDKILDLCDDTRNKMLNETDEEEAAAMAVDCLVAITCICNNAKKSMADEKEKEEE